MCVHFCYAVHVTLPYVGQRMLCQTWFFLSVMLIQRGQTQVVKIKFKYLSILIQLGGPSSLLFNI